MFSSVDACMFKSARPPLYAPSSPRRIVRGEGVAAGRTTMTLINIEEFGQELAEPGDLSATSYDA